MAQKSVWLMSGAAAAAMMMAMMVLSGVKRTSLLQKSKLASSGVDPREAGSLIYAIEGEVARDNLQRSMDEANKERMMERQRMLDRQRQRDEETDARMFDACNRNPSLPGCPYYPKPSRGFDTVDPAAAGPLVYAVYAQNARDNLNYMRNAEKDEVMYDRYQQDVERFEREMAVAERMIDACNRDPSLAGCPYYPNIRPPTWPSDPTKDGDLIYAKGASDARDALERNRQESEDYMRWVHDQEAAEAAQRKEAEAERLRISCQLNPSLPGCPY
ncbi:hypothetical protein GUITHDRAFT_151970 [Guillardia theta CCMP2712]|uniref:Uncharacterized protein n=1 Tax=Guillardia theta (strain CCMP2712) TaxID=905079 RepID=L1JH47_GUITC|nr:hypothetical protein GUITHDRAFT_151970 [Guillardia theta CCMP2712]EKX47806.1 hypothetical protein GUITHDRAFT_151970 [Guillardia theta CCMP2712]|eukprot:XP_005834786.1 hypothetical protein GUITHDRAFT_151970 [Guillardia theta CCMP2712]